jgi:hypothetical protein
VIAVLAIVEDEMKAIAVPIAVFKPRDVIPIILMGPGAALHTDECEEAKGSRRS